QQIEKDFTARIETDPLLMKKYGEALPLINEAYRSMEAYNLARWYMVEAVLSGSELLTIANRHNRLHEMLNKKDADAEAIQKETDRLKESVEGLYKNYDATLDQQMLAR
ncbi:S46 family peptidase, partial [Arthrospira platensis SPKY1]|nr:S46 family peptidase [Arthrospira platensis SPKY1]